MVNLLRRSHSAIGLLITAWLASSLAVAPSAAAADFCESRVVHNYLKPLEAMPDLRGLPVNERPAFKPHGVFIGGGYGTEQLQVGEGSIGYFISYGRPSPRLNWLVTAKLTTVDRRGDVRELLGFKQEALGRPNPESSTDLSFEVTGKPALYREVLAIRKLSGELLGKFGTYVRVVRPRIDARLTLTQSSYRPGEVVYGQVENFGTVPVRYGVPYSVERDDGTAWRTAPESPQGPWILPLLGSPAGRSGVGCLAFSIPDTMPTGTYRIVKEVTYETGASMKPGPRVLTAEFDLAP